MSAAKTFVAFPNSATTAEYVRIAREERARAMSGLLIGAFEALRRWYAGRCTEKALADLDDRILADIGLTRDDIRQIARGHYLVETASLPAPTPPAAPANAAHAQTRAA
jgi:uncharacterized protein YjiS (DUF1127 family)